MSILAGVFHAEQQLDEALSRLFTHGVFETDVFLMRGEKAVTPMPALPNVAMVEGDLADLSITEEERKKLKMKADEGKIICFVFAEPDQERVVKNVFQIADEMVDLSDGGEY